MGPSQADLSRRRQRSSANESLFGFQLQQPKSSSGSEVAGEKWRDASCKKLPLVSEMRVNSLDNNGGTGRVRWQLLGGSSPYWFWSLRRKKREYQLKDIGGLSHGVCVGL